MLAFSVVMFQLNDEQGCDIDLQFQNFPMQFFDRSQLGFITSTFHIYRITFATNILGRNIVHKYISIHTFFFGNEG